jgi:hypothetical protein
MQYRPKTSLLAPVILLLGSCSEPTAFSPLPDAPRMAQQAKRAQVVFDFRKARLLDNGDVEVTVRLRCPEGFEALEEPFVLRQGDLTAFGFSGGICDAHWDRRTVRVFRDDPEGPGFQRGPATARMQLTVENPTTGELLVTQVEEVLAIR